MQGWTGLGKKAQGLLLVVVVALLAACGGGSGGSGSTGGTSTEPNNAPHADAGVDQSVTPNSLVTLDASASSDYEGDTLSYAWTLAKPVGSSAVLARATSQKPTFTADAFGNYEATLVVSDGHGNSDSSTVTIAVGARVTTFTGALPGADGVGTAASYDGISAMARVGGAIYVADKSTIRKVDIATGVSSTFIGKRGEADVVDGTGDAVRLSPTALTSDGRYLYLMDYYNSVLRKIDIATKTVTTMGSGAKAFVADGKGNLYLVRSNKILKMDIASGVVTTFAGAETSGNADGVGVDARFESPQNIAYDGANLWVAGSMSSILRKIEVATAKVSTVTFVRSPFWIDEMVSEGGSLYVLDHWSWRIVKIDTSSGATADMWSSGYGSGMTSDGTHLYRVQGDGRSIARAVLGDGPGFYMNHFSGLGLGENGTSGATSYLYPEDMVRSGDYLYVADGRSSIRRVTLATGATITIAGENGTSGALNGTGTAARFNSPKGITSDGINLYVADTSNHVIRQIVIATGEVSTLAGKAGTSGKENGVGENARFYNPWAVTYDGKGNLYVADMQNHLIRKVVIATGEVVTIAGSGQKGSTDAVGVLANFSQPMGLAFVSDALYVANNYEDNLRKIDLASGAVSTLKLKDEAGSEVKLNGPRKISSDGTYLYVTVSSKIYRVEIATGVTTDLAGAGGGFFDGIGEAAQFRDLMGVAVVGNDLYAADKGNGAIRKIQIKY